MWKRKAVTSWLGVIAVSVLAAAGSGCASKARTKPPLPVAKSTAAKPAPKKPVLPVPDQGGDDYVSGQRYYTGDGVTQDYKQAEEFFRRAAERGHAYAQYSLGLMYDHGYGVKGDSGEARRWYQKAAAGGDSRATQRLAALDTRAAAGPVASGLGPEVGGEPAGTPSVPAGTELIKPAAPAPGPAAPVAATGPVIVAVPAGRRAGAAVARPPVAAPPPAPVVAADIPPPPAELPSPAAAAPAPQAPLTSVAPSLPPARPVLSPLPVKQAAAAMSPTTAQAISDYQTAMSAANYGMALRALEMAREAGEITALGLSETQSAEELARMAILANDGSLAQVYLRQAAALGSLPAQDALNRLAIEPDLRVLSTFVNRDALPATPAESGGH